MFQTLGWTPSLIEFHKSMFLICTFAYIVHQLVLSCYAHVLHLFFIIISQFQLQFPLMFLSSVGAFSSFCHADTISHARWCSLLSYVHCWKREMVVVVVVAVIAVIPSSRIPILTDKSRRACRLRYLPGAAARGVDVPSWCTSYCLSFLAADRTSRL